MRPLPATAVFYGISFCARVPTWVVMAVFLVEELGLSPLELVLIGTALEVAVLLFEVPTGAIADVYGRRLSLAVGFLGIGASWCLIAAATAPWHVIVLSGLWGVSATFTSGAFQAWIADEVGVERVRSVFLRGARAGQAGAVLGLVLQVAVGSRSLEAGILVGGAFNLLAGVACILVMPETGFRRRPRSERASALVELRTATLGAGRYARARPIILLLIGVAFFMGASSEAFDRLKEAHFLREVGVPGVDPVVWFGGIWLAGMAIGFIAIGLLIPRVERAGRSVAGRLLLAFASWELVAMLVFALSGSAWLAGAALLAVFLARDLARPLFDAWLNEQVSDSRVRATVISLTGQGNAVGQAGGGALLGFVGNVWGIRAALVGGALAIAPALSLFARAAARERPLPAPSV